MAIVPQATIFHEYIESRRDTEYLTIRLKKHVFESRTIAVVKTTTVASRPFLVLALLGDIQAKHGNLSLSYLLSFMKYSSFVSKLLLGGGPM